jgi:hypothetical protein
MKPSIAVWHRMTVSIDVATMIAAMASGPTFRINRVAWFHPGRGC